MSEGINFAFSVSIPNSTIESIFNSLIVKKNEESFVKDLIKMFKVINSKYFNNHNEFSFLAKEFEKTLLKYQSNSKEDLYNNIRNELIDFDKNFNTNFFTNFFTNKIKLFEEILGEDKYKIFNLIKDYYPILAEKYSKFSEAKSFFIERKEEIAKKYNIDLDKINQIINLFQEKKEESDNVPLNYLKNIFPNQNFDNLVKISNLTKLVEEILEKEKLEENLLNEIQKEEKKEEKLEEVREIQEKEECSLERILILIRGIYGIHKNHKFNFLNENMIKDFDNLIDAKLTEYQIYLEILIIIIRHYNNEIIPFNYFISFYQNSKEQNLKFIYNYFIRYYKSLNNFFEYDIFKENFSNYFKPQPPTIVENLISILKEFEEKYKNHSLFIENKILINKFLNNIYKLDKNLSEEELSSTLKKIMISCINENINDDNIKSKSIIIISNYSNSINLLIEYIKIFSSILDNCKTKEESFKYIEKYISDYLKPNDKYNDFYNKIKAMIN